MVDRISKINPHDHLRVDEIGEEEDEARKRQEEEEEEEEKKKSNSFESEKKRMDELLLQEKAYQRHKGPMSRVELAQDEIAEVIFEGVELKTDPSLLRIQLYKKDGQFFKEATLALPRSLAIRYRVLKLGSVLDFQNFLNENAKMVVLIPQEQMSEEASLPEVIESHEPSLSQTLKMLLKKTWPQRLGIKDSQTNRKNQEVILAYVTVLVIILAFVLAVWLIL